MRNVVQKTTSRDFGSNECEVRVDVLANKMADSYKCTATRVHETFGDDVYINGD